MYSDVGEQVRLDLAVAGAHQCARNQLAKGESPLAEKRMRVSEFLSRALELSGKTQKELAQEVGYTRPNIISMMCADQTKVPLGKVPAMSRALGIDPANFMRIAMREYMPTRRLSAR